jgi:DNA polymerase III epsilon subunit-like protein
MESWCERNSPFVQWDTMKAFSENIIFFDTEFSSLNPYRGEILSMGLIKFTGEELYLELDYDGEVDEWVKKNVLPLLQQPKVSREEALEVVDGFVGDSKPYLMAYVNQFDAVYWYKLIEYGKNPFHWIPIDFASILFAAGRNPQSYDWRHRDNFFREFGIDYSHYREHHALDDARLLRDVYLRFFRNTKIENR